LICVFSIDKYVYVVDCQQINLKTIYLRLILKHII